MTYFLNNILFLIVVTLKELELSENIDFNVKSLLILKIGTYFFNVAKHWLGRCIFEIIFKNLANEIVMSYNKFIMKTCQSKKKSAKTMTNLLSLKMELRQNEQTNNSCFYISRMSYSSQNKGNSITLDHSEVSRFNGSLLYAFSSIKKKVKA